jgi:hypothetical protein
VGDLGWRKSSAAQIVQAIRPFSFDLLGHGSGDLFEKSTEPLRTSGFQGLCDYPMGCNSHSNLAYRGIELEKYLFGVFFVCFAGGVHPASYSGKYLITETTTTHI